MRCHDTVLRVQKWIVGRGRLARKYIYRGACQAAAVERIGQILFHDQRATRHVDEKGARFHQSQRSCINDSLGLREQRAVQTHDIGLSQQFIDFAPSEVGPLGDRASHLIECNYAKIERQCYFGYAPSNPTKANDSDRLAGQLDQGRFPEGEVLRSGPLSSAGRLTVESNAMT